eukprot:CAMPEP_0170620154 /NCGR_PEP_ID=MMETSP0224-20130122/27906_1 /TAXON_ID=285029 /ORGANISM="Togula jolla, Strain CCCM 725" /LENGTH=245 /DNA_ID=CAMNT_0010946307 /DNA_START=21 /DNA_END=758 /DNA_ORIENTATION=+
MPELDEAALNCLLGFVGEPRGRLCCQAWSKHLYESLNLKNRIRFNKHIRTRGSIFFHHSAVRALGEEFEECVTYQFEFRAEGSYSLQWTRTFDGWTSDMERQLGTWTVVDNAVQCDSGAGPADVKEGSARYAPAGLRYELPIDDVLEGSTRADKHVPDWEFLARGLQVPQKLEEQDVETEVGSMEYVHTPSSAAASPTFHPQAGARYVEIDGEAYEVSGDIRELYDESEWERLMRCRVRFGLRGH